MGWGAVSGRQHEVLASPGQHPSPNTGRLRRYASPALGGCLQRQHDARLAEQPADAVAGAGALLHKPWRARCTMSRACWSTVLMGTRRIGGRCTALQMAAASAPSFLPRLPLMRHGATNFGATSRTVWPSAWNCRAQWCVPEQASTPS